MTTATTHKHTIAKGATLTGSAASLPGPQGAQGIQGPKGNPGATPDLTTILGRLTALEGSMANVLLRVAAVEAHFAPPAPPSGGVVVQFPGSGASTPAALLALMADTATDVIEIAAGTYTAWVCFVNVARPSARPLLIRPAAGAAVVWDGGGGEDPAWRIGWSSLASYITFDPAGTGGSFKIQNYDIGLAGLVMARYTDHVTFNGVIVRNCTGTVTPQTSHALYLDSDGTHRAQRWTSNNWDVVGPANKYLNGVHIYHTPSTDHVTLHGWTASSLFRAGFLDGDATGIDVDGWTIDNCTVTFDAVETAAGVIRNCHATSSGTTVFGAGHLTDAAITDGGGNTWT